MTNKNFNFLALTVLLSAFLFLTAITSSNFAYGSEISLQSPWDVSVEVTHGSDKFTYSLSDNVSDSSKYTLYIGKNAKLKLYRELKRMQLPEEAIYNYILPGFGNLIKHFGYVKVDRLDANLNFDGKFTYFEGQDGVDIDKEKLFYTMLLNTGKRCTVKLPLKYDKAVTVEELKQITVLKGKYTTSFSQSGANRCFNIEKCCKTINGTIVKDGEKFSFNEVVGPRTEQNGYKNAVVINQGKYVEGVGGGVCQASTTLYNALLLANFLPSAHAHTLACSYVEPGFDAMVAYGASDLSFVNDSGSTVYIAAEVANKKVTFCVYGVKNKYSVRRESQFVRTPFETKYVLDKTLPYGHEKIVCNGSDGISSKSYLIYLDGEKEVKRVSVRSDVYKKIDQIVSYNPCSEQNETNADCENF